MEILLPFCEMGQTFTVLIETLGVGPTFTILTRTRQTFTLPWDYGGATHETVPRKAPYTFLIRASLCSTPPPILSPDAPYMPSYSGMSLGRGIQGTDLPPTSYPPPPRPLPNPQVTLPSTPPPLCHPRSRFLPLPLCGACPFVGYCGFSQ